MSDGLRSLPDAAHDLVAQGPIARWDEALPLGNGRLGALVWGDGHPLRLSLDRGDLWDLRPVSAWDSPDCNYRTMRRWVAEGRLADLHRLYEAPYDDPAPTKIPAGRLEVRGLGAVAGSRLRHGGALAVVECERGRVETFVAADEPVGLVRVQGTAATAWAAVPPRFAAEPGVPPQRGDLALLGYPQARARSEPLSAGQAAGFVQSCWGGMAYAVAVGWRPNAGGTLAAWTVATDAEGGDPWRVAVERLAHALADGWEILWDRHAAWWAAYWRRSTLSVPDPALQGLWCRETYKFGALARRGAPPISLQSVWTADDGTLPPWRGDYHHDLNTQLSYWPCYTGNRLEGGLGFLDWLWEVRGEAARWTESFFGLPGLNMPMTTDLLGRQIGGWHPYTHSATTGAWLAHHFDLHWRYSGDRDFLAERAYPYLRDVCVFLEAVTEHGADGKRLLPLSSSPEIGDNRLDAWMPPTSNYDLALIRWAAGAAAEMAGVLGREGDRGRWLRLLAEFPALSHSPDDGRLLVAPGVPLRRSHRHFSHLMAIHPLGLVTWEGGERDRRAMSAALAELDRLGPSEWCGYSYAWLASMAARARDGDRAARALLVFARAFCSSNGFHVNGDQTGGGLSGLTYRPFTLEGNLAAGAGLQEMLLQSHGGRIRPFPAVPAAWEDADFEGMRAEGGCLVSARRAGRRTVAVELTAEAAGTVVVDLGSGDGLAAPPGAARTADGAWSVRLQRGETVVWR